MSLHPEEREKTKAHKIVGGIFGIIGLAGAIYLIVLGVQAYLL